MVGLFRVLLGRGVLAAAARKAVGAAGALRGAPPRPHMAAAPPSNGGLLNSMARPIGFYAILGLFIYPMVAPAQAAVSFASLALIPEPIVVLAGGVFAAFYGGRMQLKAQQFKAAAQAAPEALESIQKIKDQLSPGVADAGTDAHLSDSAVAGDGRGNAAVDAWRKGREKR